MIIKFPLKFLLLALPLGAISQVKQDTSKIGLKEVLQAVEDQNQTLQIKNQEYEAASAQHRQSQAAFLPQVSLSHTGSRTNNPVFAFGGKLNQGVFAASDFNITNLNKPKAISNFRTAVEVKQPLLNFDAFSQRAALKDRAQAKRLQKEYASGAQELEAHKAYMQLQLAHRSLKVLEKALMSSQSNLKISRDFHHQGLISKAELLLVKMRVSEVREQLAEAQNSIGDASSYLSFLMNETNAAVFQPRDSLSIQPFQEKEKPKAGLTKDILAMQKAEAARRAMWNAEKLDFLPSLNAFGNYQFYDSDIFQGSSQNYLIGVQLQWDLFKGSRRLGKIQESRAEYRKAQLEKEKYQDQKQLEIHKVRRSMNRLAIQLKTQILSVEQAKEALRITRDRYKQGLEKTADLQRAESTLQEKELLYAQSIFRYNYAAAYYQFLTND